MSTYREKLIWTHGKKTAIYKPRREASEGSETLNLDFPPRELWEIDFCCLSHTVGAVWLQQPWQTGITCMPSSSAKLESLSQKGLSYGHHHPDNNTGGINASNTWSASILARMDSRTQGKVDFGGGGSERPGSQDSLAVAVYPNLLPMIPISMGQQKKTMKFFSIREKQVRSLLKGLPWWFSS